jgi:hypothetical protein
MRPLGEDRRMKPLDMVKIRRGPHTWPHTCHTRIVDNCFECPLVSTAVCYAIRAQLPIRTQLPIRSADGPVGKMRLTILGAVVKERSQSNEISTDAQDALRV